MTDNELIKVQEEALRVAKETINRQKAEIEALINGQENLGKHIEKQKEEIDNLTNIIKARNRDNKRLTLENLQMIASIKGLASEARKEFAERLKEKSSHILDFDMSIINFVEVDDIDNLLEEMESERE